MNRTEPIVSLVPYLISNFGTDQTPLFREPSDYHHFLDVLRTAAALHRVRILARRLEPAGFRLILEQQRDGSIPKMMHLAQTSVALRFNYRYRRKGRLFQGPYKNQRIFSAHELRTTLDALSSFQGDPIHPTETRLWIHSSLLRLTKDSTIILS